jgi:hypothetical protein
MARRPPARAQASAGPRGNFKVLKPGRNLPEKTETITAAQGHRRETRPHYSGQAKTNFPAKEGKK